MVTVGLHAVHVRVGTLDLKQFGMGPGLKHDAICEHRNDIRTLQVGELM